MTQPFYWNQWRANVTHIIKPNASLMLTFYLPMWFMSIISEIAVKIIEFFFFEHFSMNYTNGKLFLFMIHANWAFSLNRATIIFFFFLFETLMSTVWIRKMFPCFLEKIQYEEFLFRWMKTAENVCYGIITIEN